MKNFEFHQDRSGQLDVLMGQAIVLSEIKAEVPWENDISSNHNLLFNKKNESNCFHKKTEGFIHVVEVGQYFMTKDTEEELFAKAFREYTLRRHDGSSQPNESRETQKLDPCWKSGPVICTVYMELKSESGL